MKTVLIVDDHAGFRRQARHMLEAAGYDVIGEATDGSSGLEAVLALGPDVVLLDVQLPDMTGFDVAQALEGTPTWVVLISSRTAADYGQRIADSGVRGFISKMDLSSSALETVLRRAG